MFLLVKKSHLSHGSTPLYVSETIESLEADISAWDKIVKDYKNDNENHISLPETIKIGPLILSKDETYSEYNNGNADGSVYICYSYESLEAIEVPKFDADNA